MHILLVIFAHIIDNVYIDLKGALDMKQELCTRRNQNDYERIVDIFILKSKNDLPYINNDVTCKLLILKKGTLSLLVNGKHSEPINIKSPSAIFFSNNDRIEICSSLRFEATIIFFKPSFINDAFSYDRLYRLEFEKSCGTTLYQDYILVRNFVMKDDKLLKYSHLSDISLTHIMDLVAKMEHELKVQYDGFWPCRSRSFFIELLFSLNFSSVDDPYNLDEEKSFTASVIEYLNQHMDEKIDLSAITKEFHINRNYLNQQFINETGVTCLSYLLRLRMDLAKMWLLETDIPVGEIGRRLGYLDQNYFAKVFKKECGVSPSGYRQDRMISVSN